MPARATHLAADRTVFTYGRRGRRASADTDEDLAPVLAQFFKR